MRVPAPKRWHSGSPFDLSSVKSALQDPYRRRQVLQWEDEVVSFLASNCRSVLRFAAKLTSFDRAMAIVVARYYGLKAKVIEGDSRYAHVLATRTPESALDKPRLRSFVGSRLAGQAAGKPKEQLQNKAGEPNGPEDGPEDATAMA